MEARQDYSRFMKNALFIFLLTTSLNVNALTTTKNYAAANSDNYNEAIVITERNHVLSAHTVMLKTAPEERSTPSIKPQVVTTTYDDLATVQEKTTPRRVEHNGTRRCHGSGSGCLTNSFTIK